ncbi:MAG: helix-turn-helix domain-containing protein [Chloroflexota bacterium]
MSESLGPVLKTFREARGYSLRDVEGRLDTQGQRISNGYLSLLENGKVKDPSPRVLWALSHLYEADYLDLMRRAGYPVPGQPTSPAQQPGIAFHGTERLSDEDREEIQSFINWKLNRRKKQV